MEAREYSEGRHISEHLERMRQNIELNTKDPVARGGFTQVPNFILEHPNLSIGAKVIYAMFLRYAWHNNLVFPGQQRLADAVEMSVSRVNDFVKELEKAKLIEICPYRKYHPGAILCDSEVCDMILVDDRDHEGAVLDNRIMVQVA